MNRITVFLFAFVAALVPTVAFAQEDLPPAPEVPPDPVSSSVLDGLLLMSNESLVMMVAGVVLSMASGVIFRQTWSDDIKAALFFGACVAFGAIYTLAQDDNFSGADMGRRIILVLATGTVFYQLFKGPMQAFTTRTDAALNRTP
jgi:hypothetical protein